MCDQNWAPRKSTPPRKCILLPIDVLDLKWMCTGWLQGGKVQPKEAPTIRASPLNRRTLGTLMQLLIHAMIQSAEHVTTTHCILLRWLLKGCFFYPANQPNQLPYRQNECCKRIPTAVPSYCTISRWCCRSSDHSCSSYWMLWLIEYWNTGKPERLH